MKALSHQANKTIKTSVLSALDYGVERALFESLLLNYTQTHTAH